MTCEPVCVLILTIEKLFIADVQRTAVTYVFDIFLKRRVFKVFAVFSFFVFSM